MFPLIMLDSKTPSPFPADYPFPLFHLHNQPGTYKPTLFYCELSSSSLLYNFMSWYARTVNLPHRQDLSHPFRCNLTNAPFSLSRSHIFRKYNSNERHLCNNNNIFINYVSFLYFFTPNFKHINSNCFPVASKVGVILPSYGYLCSRIDLLSKTLRNSKEFQFSLRGRTYPTSHHITS